MAGFCEKADEFPGSTEGEIYCSASLVLNVQEKSCFMYPIIAETNKNVTF
jgi:hypothetical protein